MKLVLVAADAARFDALQHDLVELGAPGYTALPVTQGTRGTGLHTGDRVHAGALVRCLRSSTMNARYRCSKLSSGAATPRRIPSPASSCC